ncbi:MAG: DUF551 domain-containing protein [Burkholderiaceae bacterium]|nr:DUF551 domain-containing protein [Burkholderiaceae bacterium]
MTARQYPLPDSLYAGSKDWLAADYAGRVEWLHSMYENAREQLDTLTASPVPKGPVIPSIDVERLIEECIPGGSVCDPQYVADEIRRYCNAWPGSSPAVAPVAPVAGWQPIETAPKDGTAILLGSRGGAWIGKWLPVYVSGYRPDNPWSSLMLNHDHMGEKWCKPTHWMPLPAAPGLAAAPAVAPVVAPKRWQEAVAEAYGYLWHVNNDPAAPIPLYSPERAAYEARKRLRDLLTTEQRGAAINIVGRGLGRYEDDAPAAAPQPEQGAQPDPRDEALALATNALRVISRWRMHLGHNDDFFSIKREAESTLARIDALGVKP